MTTRTFSGAPILRHRATVRKYIPTKDAGNCVSPGFVGKFRGDPLGLNARWALLNMAALWLICFRQTRRNPCHNFREETPRLRLRVLYSPD